MRATLLQLACIAVVLAGVGLAIAAFADTLAALHIQQRFP